MSDVQKSNMVPLGYWNLNAWTVIIPKGYREQIKIYKGLTENGTSGWALAESFELPQV